VIFASCSSELKVVIELSKTEIAEDLSRLSNYLCNYRLLQSLVQ